ncbi:hypothetical protein [Tabrizicola sp.]|uniref:hypothetical protein n=1 Tax=Tabrizicola sp. TaxID=2005166 RepID=UPI0026265E95|nr:hypothetical protein [Tabrizicola sp.]MDM7932264.1 hypothetical protein [Tabrizicola sp.]
MPHNPTFLSGSETAAPLGESGGAGGRHRPGAIATATKLGATRVYQLLDKMRDTGRVHVALDGHISEGGS